MVSESISTQSRRVIKIKSAIFIMHCIFLLVIQFNKVHSPTNFVKGAKSQGKDSNKVENTPTMQTVHKLAV